MSYPYTYDQYVEASRKYMEEIITFQWYLPMKLKLIEQDINKLINQIFQERPSLP